MWPKQTRNRTGFDFHHWQLPRIGETNELVILVHILVEIQPFIVVGQHTNPAILWAPVVGGTVVNESRGPQNSLPFFMIPALELMKAGAGLLRNGFPISFSIADMAPAFGSWLPVSATERIRKEDNHRHLLVSHGWPVLELKIPVIIPTKNH